MNLGRQIWAIVVGAGSGARFGQPKQFLQLGGLPLIVRSVRAARSVASRVVVVLPEWGVDYSCEADVVVAGGATRSASVRAGLSVVPEDVDIVLVHDAARPLASPALFRMVAKAVEDGAPAAVPGVPVADTLKRVDGDASAWFDAKQPKQLKQPNRYVEVVETLDRDGLVAIQTPQAFRANLLRQAHEIGGDASDDAVLLERAGVAVAVVPGDPKNIKITFPDDLLVAEVLLSTMDLSTPATHPAESLTTPAGSSVPQAPGSSALFRTGIGFDVHRLIEDPDRKLVLGGIAIDSSLALVGHSDADVIAHAAIDALLGAAGLGDIGMHFPDNDEQFNGADSMEMLSYVVSMVKETGWSVSNLDCTVIAERPKLAEYRRSIQERMSVVVGSPVSIKATRMEGLGPIGQGDGVATLAVATLERSRHLQGKI